MFSQAICAKNPRFALQGRKATLSLGGYGLSGEGGYAPPSPDLRLFGLTVCFPLRKGDTASELPYCQRIASERHKGKIPPSLRMGNPRSETTFSPLKFLLPLF